MNEKALANMPEDEKFDKIAKVLTPFIEGFAKLSDEDIELVLVSTAQARLK